MTGGAMILPAIAPEILQQLETIWGVKLGEIVSSDATPDGQLVVFLPEGEGEDPMAVLFLGKTVIDCGYF